VETLEFTPGATWLRYFSFNDTVTGPVGDSTWGAEFGLVDTSNCDAETIVAASVGNGITWYGPGCIFVSFTQLQSALWSWKTASWYLTLTNPNTQFDGQGTKSLVAQGIASLKPIAQVMVPPNNLLIPFPSQFGGY
jgi:hypothetical protein